MTKKGQELEDRIWEYLELYSEVMRLLPIVKHSDSPSVALNSSHKASNSVHYNQDHHTQPHLSRELRPTQRYLTKWMI